MSSCSILRSYRKMILSNKGKMSKALGVSPATYKKLENLESPNALLIESVLKMILGGKEGLQESIHIKSAYCMARIKEYKDEHPDATWKEVYNNVPSAYSTHHSMATNYLLKIGGSKRYTSSRFRGVYIKHGYIAAGIKVNGKNIHLGSFKKEEDAARAYDEAALKYFGYGATTNLSKGLI